MALNHSGCSTDNNDFDKAARCLCWQLRVDNNFWYTWQKTSKLEYSLFDGSARGTISKTKIDKLWRWAYRRPLQFIRDAINRLPAIGNPSSPAFVIVSAPGFFQRLQHPLLVKYIEGYCRDAKLPNPVFIGSTADSFAAMGSWDSWQGIIAEGAAYAASIDSSTKTVETEIPPWKSPRQVFWDSRNKLHQQAIQNQTLRRSARLQPDSKELSHDPQSRKRKEPSSDPKSDEARTSCTTAVVAPTTSIFGNGMRDSKRQKTGP